jgi:deoxycytidine triphosphate deaminase
MSDENASPSPQPPDGPQPEQQTGATPRPEPIAKAPPPIGPNKEPWLWADPYLTNDELSKRLNTGSVLLAEDIIRYIMDYDVLIDQEDFKMGEELGAKLKGASYTMTPDEKGAWIYLPDKPNGGDVQKPITPEKDDIGPFYLIPKNSLVYIKIRQRLRIPFYIIGRHNLKIRYVYQGLLLGTGPQVDPGFCGNLFIPLHNFTTRDVKVYINQSFISIDFTRTTDISWEGEPIPSSIDDLYNRFEKKKHLIERTKVKDRVNITKYLEGATPRSQMGQFQYDFGSLEEKVKQEFINIENTKKQMVWERLAVVVSLISFLIATGSLIYASLNYYRGFVADFKSETDRVKNIASSAHIASIENRIVNLESNSEAVSMTMSNLIQTQVSSQLASQRDLIKNVKMSQEELNYFHQVFERYRTNAMNTNVRQ